MLSPVVRIVDDDTHLLSALGFVLTVAGFAVAKYPSAETFLEKDDFSRPGCVVLDIRMSGMNGLQCQQALLERGLSLPVLFLTGHGDVDMAVNALKYGAADFLQKPVEAEKLSAICRKLVQWHVSLCLTREAWAADAAKVASLTPREREAAELVATGLPNKIIAERLGVSEPGVKFHRTNIYRKLEVRSAVEVGKMLARTAAGMPSAAPGELLHLQAVE